MKTWYVIEVVSQVGRTERIILQIEMENCTLHGINKVGSLSHIVSRCIKNQNIKSQIKI